MKRLCNLDYLRGLVAFGIMTYHYFGWTFGKFSADTFMGRLGIYGVSIFYVLSGLTLYFVYYDKMKPSKEDLISFIKKRIFRIFPLLWLVTFVAILLTRKIPDFYDVFLNLSGLFGFFKWETYFSPGVWSIGNELVFYAFFPFFILFTKSYKPLMFLLAIVIFGIYIFFAFNKLNHNLTLSEQWSIYSNPLNQVFLFLGGFFIGLFLQNIQIKNSILLVLLFFSFIVFIFYPVSGDPINLVTGVNRLVFTTCCFIFCISFYKMKFTLPEFIHKPLTLLGEASYSVYLLHPLVYNITGIAFSISSKYLFNFPESIRLIISIVTTLSVSYYVYQNFESFFMKLGRTRNKNIG